MPPLAIPIAIAASGAAIGIGMSQSAKAQKKAMSAAQEQQNAAIAEQQRQEVAAKEEQQRLEQKYGLTPGELDREARTFDLEKQRQGELQRRAGLSGEALLRENGPITQNLMDTIASRQGKTGTDLFLQEGGLPAQQYYDRVTAPGVQDTFAPELELVRQQINAEANRRGVFGGLPEGGIRFEQLGRAGVDLAIKSARESLAQKQALATALINLPQNVRAEAGNVASQGISSGDQARAELQKFLADQQNLSQSARQRDANVGVSAANMATNRDINAADLANRTQSQAYGVVTDIYGNQAGAGQRLAQGGFDALGNLATFAIPSSPTGTPLPSSGMDLTSLNKNYLPGEKLSGQVGGDFLQDEYTSARRRRLYG